MQLIKFDINEKLFQISYFEMYIHQRKEPWFLRKY